MHQPPFEEPVDAQRHNGARRFACRPHLGAMADVIRDDVSRIALLPPSNAVS
jgi:hypothetical protein